MAMARRMHACMHVCVQIDRPINRRIEICMHVNTRGSACGGSQTVRGTVGPIARLDCTLCAYASRAATILACAPCSAEVGCCVCVCVCMRK